MNIFVSNDDGVHAEESGFLLMSYYYEGIMFMYAHRNLRGLAVAVDLV